MQRDEKRGKGEVKGLKEERGGRKGIQKGKEIV